MKKSGEDFKLPKPLFGQSFWFMFGAKIKDMYRKHIYNAADPRDVYNQPFKKYSSGYSSQKKKGMLRRQDKTYSNTTAPVLSGDLMLDTQHSVDAKNNVIYIGWTAHASKLDWLKKNGRVLTSRDKPMPDPVMNQIMPEFNKELKKVMPDGIQTIKIGKK